ncbi:nucleoside-diphosphate-sugar epimerase [Ameyamaea chiangmaiensis NBRC 103196]|uniref:Aldehyde reductase n=1 Tax=Ameyamaea chiangmaiensis TaxID=442969 RepID=A0A850P9X8_9PROT|nr:aldehyde reductase [Ameyamaea chiangmaiensis]MBS4076288.1 aldehyde reductase [Ameyamaea chiangmaiensis]NVN39479.1 aldehyde reductase [Ameyamaea chiangmaiensis]GBQ65095.1 nucleoside-diphosphate-sugar epimerase [Ameyamaea chiangmaiensis NBRC 103196]
MTETGTVLVTGGSGYVGARCIISLLERGYIVRATVRDIRREPEVRAMVAKEIDPGDRLSVCAADLTADAGWDAAAEGVRYVLHVASPVLVRAPKDPDVLIRPARDGAARVLRAAIRAGAERVVMTSSVAAASRRVGGPDCEYDETVWTDPDAPGVDAYTRSKTIAERTAWEIIGAEGGATTLAVVNPSVILGPVLGRDFSPSIGLVQRLLAGKVPGLPRLGFEFVDVRDLADLHLRAMTNPAAAGQRFIGAGEFAWMADIARVLKAALGPEAAKVPTRALPDFVLRLVGLFDRDLGAMNGYLGHRYTYSSAKAQSVLGWKARPLEETVVDCGRSLITIGAV